MGICSEESLDQKAGYNHLGCRRSMALSPTWWCGLSSPSLQAQPLPPFELSASSPVPGYIIPACTASSKWPWRCTLPNPVPSLLPRGGSWNGTWIPGLQRLNLSSEQPAWGHHLHLHTVAWMEMLWIILKLPQCHWGTVKQASVIISECCNFCFTYECWGVRGLQTKT